MTHSPTLSKAVGLSLLATSFITVIGCANVPNDRGVGAGQEQRITLTLANGNSDHQELQPFADAVARLSDDTICIEFHDEVHADEPEAPAAIINDVKACTFDLGWTSAPNLHQLGVMSFDALAAPFLVDNYDLEEKVLTSDMVSPMLDGLDAIGVLGVGIQPGPLKLLSASNHALLRPEDFVGRNIAIGPSTITVEALKALGAKTITIASGGGIADAERRGSAAAGDHRQPLRKRDEAHRRQRGDVSATRDLLRQPVPFPRSFEQAAGSAAACSPTNVGGGARESPSDRRRGLRGVVCEWFRHGCRDRRESRRTPGGCSTGL